MQPLAEIAEDLVLYLNFYIEQVENTTDPEERGGAAVTVSAHYEALGICELLLDGVIDVFFHQLIRSAQTRKWLLERSKTDTFPDKVVKASLVRPLCDAIAANQFTLARDIAALSPTAWLRDVEYEDDYCYAHFLHRYLLDDPQPALEGILTQFERSLEGGDSPRFRMCSTLLHTHHDQVGEAFHQLLEEREEKIENVKATSAHWDGGDPVLYANASVFVEGLAWLRLLERKGMTMDDEYRYCPSIVRTTNYAPFQATTFPGTAL